MRESQHVGTQTKARDRVQVAVIGGGQSGLAIGHHLRRRNQDFVILEAEEDVGAAWRRRWDSLVLFTPRRYSSLPGLSFPGDPDGYATRDEVVAYLERYASTFDLPVEPNSRVRSLSRSNGTFLLELEGRSLQADQVVVATGPFQVPHVPPVASQLAADVFQIHSAGYRRPADIPPGTVVVAGGGNSGFQIAKELAATHAVHLAIGSRQTPLPQRLLGRDVFWWLTKLGVIEKSVDSRIGRRARSRDTLIGSRPRELQRRYGVALEPRLVAVHGRTVGFADGTSLEPDAVVWATGYRPDHSWLALPVLDDTGRVRHRRGVTDVGGLYFLGLSWQHTRGSALIGWVQHDAEFIADQIARVAASSAPRIEPAPAEIPDAAGLPEGA
jgi:putative flavoprotein involved in K+ transport